MKFFIDREWLAPNVMRVPVNSAIPNSFADLGGPSMPSGYHVEQPPWSSDIQWISAADEIAFARFEAAFEALEIARHVREFVACERQIRMYQGFVVVRSECRRPDFHVDWLDAGNQAFTMLTPIGVPHAGFGLAYKTLKDEVRAYDYVEGEALIFGDHFVHSTRPGKSPHPTMLLSFTFGTDKMEDWPVIRRTAGHQGGKLRRPDGVFE
jgi:hypothetical protein